MPSDWETILKSALEKNNETLGIEARRLLPLMLKELEDTKQILADRDCEAEQRVRRLEDMVLNNPLERLANDNTQLRLDREQLREALHYADHRLGLADAHPSECGKGLVGGPPGLCSIHEALTTVGVFGTRVAPYRCEVTGNPCGTDTRPKQADGQVVPCSCRACRNLKAAEMMKARIGCEHKQLFFSNGGLHIVCDGRQGGCNGTWVLTRPGTDEPDYTPLHEGQMGPWNVRTQDEAKEAAARKRSGR